MTTHWLKTFSLCSKQNVFPARKSSPLSRLVNSSMTIHFYNFERFQLKHRLAPFQKRSQSALFFAILRFAFLFSVYSFWGVAGSDQQVAFLILFHPVKEPVFVRQPADGEAFFNTAPLLLSIQSSRFRAISRLMFAFFRRTAPHGRRPHGFVLPIRYRERPRFQTTRSAP